MTGLGRLGLILLVVLMGGGILSWIRAEGEAPTVDGPPGLAVGIAGRSVTLELSDSGSGLREIRVSVVTEGGEAIALEKTFPGNLWMGGGTPAHSEPVEVPIDAVALELTDGDATLEASVRDWSWRNGLRGNQTTWRIPIEVDLREPHIVVASGLTYVTRGGSGLVVYTLGESTVRDGVSVGEAFFSGHPISAENPASGRRAAIFAVPVDAPRGASIEVVAEDRAGNVGRAGWSVVLKERAFAEDNVTLSSSFLEAKVRPLAEAQGIPHRDLNAAFHQINTKLRTDNEAQIRKIVAQSSSTPLWVGNFSQLSNSKVTSRFAERRSYFANGNPISKATHFGYDLASTATAPIEASNRGRVVFAGDLGIYGNCVIVDHGLGLFTLYAHLSRLDVAIGDRVKKMERLGLSGATGLAGGDHLHFGVIVGGTYVDPLEWWDPLWVRTHIENHLIASAL